MGGDGKQARNLISENKGAQLLNAQAGAASDPRLTDLMGKYSRGEISLQDALSQSGHDNGARRSQLQKSIANFKSLQAGGIDKADGIEVNPQISSWEKELNDLSQDEELNRTRQHQFYTDPSTGTLVATEQVQNNPLFSGMFGKGGMNDRMMEEEKQLASRGFSLQPEDYEAYGQAAGDTARMFGAEEQNLSQALAARGLASAPSGAAGVGFSGLMGNKSERLASAQRKIADDRMKMNQQRLESVRGFAQKGNALAQQAVGDQFSRNRQGVNDYQTSLKDSVNAAKMMQDQENTGFEQVEQTRGPSFGEIAMGTLGTAAGAGLGAATGGIGTSLGTAAGIGLGGVNPYLTKK